MIDWFCFSPHVHVYYAITIFFCNFWKVCLKIHYLDMTPFFPKCWFIFIFICLGFRRTANLQRCHGSFPCGKELGCWRASLVHWNKRYFFLWQLKRPQERFMDNLKKICRVTLLFWKCTNVNRKIRKNMCHDQSSHD